MREDGAQTQVQAPMQSVAKEGGRRAVRGTEGVERGADGQTDEGRWLWAWTWAWVWMWARGGGGAR